ncbi:Uncharacterised protein [Raoultella planticola]|uniref:N-acetyltransferase domain-containing protein n=1 Tax=Raoultella planticola TaxID=575 RepID=A0A485ALG9_RAOPL|nr:Uncharacterised protein [Raoultella planticola]
MPPILFAAYALGDESDWTWLASTCPASVEATTHWVAGKVNDDALVPFAVIDLRTERAVGWSAIWPSIGQWGTVEIGHVTWSRKNEEYAAGYGSRCGCC